MSDDRRYWRSVDELGAGEPELAAERRSEFASGTLWQELGEFAAAPESRRDFLKLMGFSLSAAALASCTPIPERRAVPLVAQPEEMVPGVPLYYATTCGGCAAGCGLLAKTRDGRPIKLEGNGLSFAGGGTCAVGQAAVLSLYDDRRLRGPLLRGRPASWPEVDAHVGEHLAAAAARGGRIVLLTGTLHGPAARRLLADWTARFPGSKHVAYEPLSLAALRRANEASFGVPAVPRYRLDRARLVVGIEADFLGTWLSPVELTRAYARGRGRAGDGMLRHVQIEAGMSLTGSNADLRLPVLPSDLAGAAAALLAGVARRAGAVLPATAVDEAVAGLPYAAELDAVAGELWAARGESLVVAGANDLALQLVVNRLNALLGNVGRTVDLDNPSLQAQGDDLAMAGLIEEMERGELTALLLWGVNPAYDHPAAERFVRALGRVGLTVSFADRLDETAAHAAVVAPDHHFLEAWGDAEPVAGGLGLAQPAIAPLFATRAAAESLLRWMGREGDVHAYLREHWRREVFPRQDRWSTFDDFWDHALEDGVVALPAVESRPRDWIHGDHADLAPALAAIAAERREAAAARAVGCWEVRLHPQVAMRDGRHSGNPWLQELPDPVTKVTWGNYASLAPADAARLGLADGDVVAIEEGPVRLELPVQVQPGQPAGAVSIPLGYGRRSAGKVGDGIGANAFPLIAVGEGGFLRGWRTGLRLAATGRREPLAATQTHGSMEGRPIVRELARGEAGLAAAAEGEAAPANLWSDYVKEGHFWGMSIDLNACTGCAACVVACQAENNVAVVGKDEVRRGREMHWIRVDRYYSGPPERPDTSYQPMMCQQCDHAPCETVCPVLATVHSSDGLNQQVYNRCVGTRYCANNCPYKVRRFNWFDYAGNERFGYHLASDLGRMVLNPDVVVRSRGVMEKCSLCIQRIQAGKLAAEQQGRLLRDGDIATACQQACPAAAIVFGDRNDPASRLSRREREPRSYRVLAELGTRPGVGYLAKVRNRA